MLSALRRPSSPREKRPLVAGLALAVVLVAPLSTLTACSGDDGPAANPEADSDDDGEATPEEVLALAATTLDETSGVQFSLTTDDLPDGVVGLTSAAGLATSAPAFDGDITISIGGASVEVPVVAVDDEVYAQLPLTSGFQTIDPAEYGAPDPAGLVAPEEGVSSVLTSTEDVVEGETIRGGSDNSEILTEYSGTVGDTVMSELIPSAEGDFDVAYTISEEGELREAVLTGVFYPDSAAMTYTVDLEDYGLEEDVVAPSDAS